MTLTAPSPFGNRSGFTLLEMTFAVAILSSVMLILFGISEAFGTTAQVQRAKVQANEETRRALTVAIPLLRMAARGSINWDDLPGPAISFRPAADLNGNGTAVDAAGLIELGPVMTIQVDTNDANDDGVTDTQLVLLQGDTVRVLANNLVPPAAGGGEPTRATSGFWITPRDSGFEVMVRARGRTMRGLVLSTEMSQYVALRN